jgi:hypothetical protein
MKWAYLALAAALVGCGDDNGGGPDLAGGSGDDLAVTTPADLAGGELAPDNAGGAVHSHKKVDVLFMVDNSPSLSPKQALLRSGFPAFVNALAATAGTHPASYHIGVITDDLGAGPFTLNNGQCHPGGDGGKLQVAPRPDAMNVPPACTSFALGGGVRYLDYNQLAGTTNIVGGADVATAFGCMSAVGSSGCGFEQPLEATYTALHDAIPENAGFLRPDALLVVVYVTDEDDCSAPATTDLFSDAANSPYGTLHSFRCTQWGIACGTPATQVQPVDSMGPLANCRPWTVAEGSKLIDVQKYVDFFTRPASMGGVKADPTDVILMAIAAPATPFATIVTSPCADQVNTASCPILAHSCTSTSNAQLFGDPAVRLSAVVNAAPTSQIASACADDYSTELAALAQKIIARLP